jgi:UDP-glucuronate decarboxylase
MIEGLIKLMNSPDDFTGPVNLGNQSEFSIIELAHIIIKLTNSGSNIIFKPLPPDDPRQRQPDITLAKDVLLWKPSTPAEEGLQKTIRYFHDLLRGSGK